MGKSVKRKSSKDLQISAESSPPEKPPAPAKKQKNEVTQVDEEPARFVGEPFLANVAVERWPHRYQIQGKSKIKISNGSLSGGLHGDGINGHEFMQAKCHYEQAIVDGFLFNLYDDVYVKAEDGAPNFIAKIVELFETVDRELFFSAQWYFRPEDTEIKDVANLIDSRRVFYSDIKDDNPLDTIVSKVNITRLAPNADLLEREAISSCDLYCDMAYTMPLTFTALSAENEKVEIDDSSNSTIEEEVDRCQEIEMTLLDLFSGCGAMSTGLCFGAKISGVKLVTKWAVDKNPHACDSFKFNHPETEVRNESAENFLALVKGWEKLCDEHCSSYLLEYDDITPKSDGEDSVENEDSHDKKVASSREFEVHKLLDICFGDPNNQNKRGLYFKVRWKGYGPSDDTWEPIDGLSNCKESIGDFVKRGYRSKILPLPGDVDFICGGPPCQGISGYNRFRDASDPLKDEKNHQLVVFMDIIKFLKPRYILMENVVDLTRFSKGRLAYYAIGRLLSMSYQTRLGIMAAGSYGACQCRLRVFLWGASMTQSLPQFPLPTHEVIGRGVVTNEFQECIIRWDKEKSPKLEKSVLLGDAISDLPPVTNYDNNDEMDYGGRPKTSFQKYIRMRKQGEKSPKNQLYDHISLKVNEDDFARICQIPKRKGANFRDLPGVLVVGKNKVEWDPSVERVLLPSGKPLVPDYAMSFKGGRSSKPFGRLAMDEIITTVVTRAQPHNRAVLHPNQDRVLTVRENARLQGFPDHYRLSGPIKQRYIQVGNAVSFSVSIALGHTLAMAVRGASTREPLPVPIKFPDCLAHLDVSNGMPDNSSV